MRASWCVGRVGGLAVALGVGSAVFAGVASADATDPGVRGAASAGADTVSNASPSTRSRNSAAAKPSGVVRGNRQNDARANAVASTRVDRMPVPAVGPAPEVTLPQSDPQRTAEVTEVSAAPAASTVVAAQRNSPRRALVAPASVPVAAPAPAVTSFVGSATNGSADGAGADPLTVVDSPLSWAALAVSRRQGPVAASTASVAAASTGETTWTSKGITVVSEVGVQEGTVLGYYDVTNSRGTKMLYSAVGGSEGGKLTLGGLPVPGGGFSVLLYATWLDGGTKSVEKFGLRIREVTLFDALVMAVPFVGAPLVHFLQDTPVISSLLQPIVGVSVVAPIDVNVGVLAPGDTPLSFTYKVKSFDGVKISTNFFPAFGLAAGDTAPTAILAPGFGGPGLTDPIGIYALKNEVPGIGSLRSQGYDVVTFDPRGEFASGGVMRMAEPNYEGLDTSALVSWIAGKTSASLNSPDDPKVGMLGGSYGGALQLASVKDPRIDAIVPVDSWSNLLDTFYPTNAFKTGYGALYMLNLLLSSVRVDPQLYLAVATGLGFNWLSPWSKSFMNASNPPLDQLTAPTLLARGTEDVLVPLAQGQDIAEQILGNGNDAPLKVTWFTGGHGAVGLLPTGQSNRLIANTFAWLDKYVKGTGTAADAIPNFQWYDQKGDYYSSELQAFQNGFNDLPNVTARSRGGLLGIVPILGGSGPGVGGFPISVVNAGKASNAINVPINNLTAGTQIVGAPKLTFTYQGLGTGKSIYAQVIDNKTGAVLGNLVTPVPVRLDGFAHTASFDIGQIAYTVGEGDSLTLQITSSATAFENASIGLVNISRVTVALPNRNAPLG